MCDIMSSDSKIISKSKNTNEGDAGEGVEEGVESKNKEKRGKGTSLFDPPFNVDPGSCGFSEKGGNTNIEKSTTDKKRKPRGETKMSDYVVYPRMVNRIKGLGCVE